MNINKGTAQKIIDQHGISYDTNEAGLTVACIDANGERFNVVEMNSGAIFTEANHSPIIVNI